MKTRFAHLTMALLLIVLSQYSTAQQTASTDTGVTAALPVSAVSDNADADSSTAGGAVAPAATGQERFHHPKSWTAKFRADGKTHYDSNIFLLSDSAENRMQTRTAADAVNGRYNGMNSPSDYIFTPSLRFVAEGPGLAGHKLGFQAGVAYNMYFLNPMRRHANVVLAAEQNTFRHGRARFKYELTPHYFYRNYLTDATNYTTSVAPEERVYSPDIYSERNLTFEYRQRLTESGTSVTGRAGYLQRRNKGAVFVGRDRNAPHAGVGINLPVTHWWTIDSNYDIAAVRSPSAQEVMILNEPDFGVDFNNDGNTTDSSLRTVQWVSRTHHEREIHASTRLGLFEKTSLEFGYDRRFRKFASHEPFDVVHNGRTDKRNTFNAELLSHLPGGFQASTGYIYSYENSNRPGDPGLVGEVNDYRRRVGFLTLSYQF